MAKQELQTGIIDATCIVNEGGNLTCDGVNIPVQMNNSEQIKGGTITIQGKRIVGVTNLRIKNGTYNMGSDGKLVLGEIEQYIGLLMRS